MHESAHEWFGNNITSKDVADMWMHESFANYAENRLRGVPGRQGSGRRYVIGTRANVRNDAPIIAHYGVNHEGSGDMYYKGGNMLHTIRQIINDDEKWRGILRGLQQDLLAPDGHGRAGASSTSAEQAGIDLSKVFAQYLTTTKIPVFEYTIRGSTLSYRWTNVVPGFRHAGARNAIGLGLRRNPPHHETAHRAPLAPQSRDVQRGSKLLRDRPPRRSRCRR